MIKFLKSLGFTEYKLDEIPFCYEIEFPLLNKGLSYYRFSDYTEKITLYELSEGDIIKDIKLEDVEKYVHYFKWQETEINKILKTEFNP